MPRRGPASLGGPLLPRLHSGAPSAWQALGSVHVTCLEPPTSSKTLSFSKQRPFILYILPSYCFYLEFVWTIRMEEGKGQLYFLMVTQQRAAGRVFTLNRIHHRAIWGRDQLSDMNFRNLPFCVCISVRTRVNGRADKSQALPHKSVCGRMHLTINCWPAVTFYLFGTVHTKLLKFSTGCLHQACEVKNYRNERKKRN